MWEGLFVLRLVGACGHRNNHKLYQGTRPIVIPTNPEANLTIAPTLTLPRTLTLALDQVQEYSLQYKEKGEEFYIVVDQLSPACYPYS